MAATFKVTSYTRDLSKVGRRLRYYAFRSRDLPTEKRGLFSRDSENADLKKFLDSIRDDPLLQDRVTRKGNVVKPPKLHSLVFSLSRNEFDKSGLTSWKPIVREVLAEWERYRGIRLDWVAAEHNNVDNPHCHVAVKSVYWDQNGKVHRLRITRDMIDEIRWCTRLIVRRERERYQQQRQFERELEKAEREAQWEAAREFRALATTFLDMADQAAREQEGPVWEEIRPPKPKRPRRRRREGRGR